MTQIDSKNKAWTAGQRDEINLIKYWYVLKKYRKMIIGIVAVASIAAVIVSLVLTKIYRAESIIIPLQSGNGGGLAALSSKLGGLAALAGINMSSGSSDANKFMAILNSRTLTENVISKENLLPILFRDKWDAKTGGWMSGDPDDKPSMEDAVFAMRKGHMKFLYNKKENVIVISGEFEDPRLSARVVNAYVDELQNFINANSLTMAKRNRLFVENQLEENSREFLEAGKEISAFHKAKGVSSTEADLDVEVGLGRDLEALPADLPKFATLDEGQNPAINNLLYQKDDIEKKLAKAMIVEDVPEQVYLKYLLFRQQLIAQVNSLLTTQYEMAKIEEAKEDLAFQVIDTAIAPEKRIRPRRKQICVATFLISLLAAVFIALFRDYIGRIKAVHTTMS